MSTTAFSLLNLDVFDFADEVVGVVVEVETEMAEEDGLAAGVLVMAAESPELLGRVAADDRSIDGSSMDCIARGLSIAMRSCCCRASSVDAADEVLGVTEESPGAEKGKKESCDSIDCCISICSCSSCCALLAAAADAADCADGAMSCSRSG